MTLKPPDPLMSDTPRTDALGNAWEEADRKYGHGMRVLQPDDPQDIWDFARQLERELATITAQLMVAIRDEFLADVERRDDFKWPL